MSFLPPLHATPSWHALTASGLLPSVDDSADDGAAFGVRRVSTASLASSAPLGGPPLHPVWSWTSSGEEEGGPVAGPSPFVAGGGGGMPVSVLPYVLPLPLTDATKVSLKRERSLGLDLLAVGVPCGEGVWHQVASPPPPSPVWSPPRRAVAAPAAPPPRRAPAITHDNLATRLPTLPTRVTLPCGAVAMLAASLWRQDGGGTGIGARVAVTLSADDSGGGSDNSGDGSAPARPASAGDSGALLSHALVSAFNPRTVTTGAPRVLPSSSSTPDAPPSSVALHRRPSKRWPTAGELRTQELFLVGRRAGDAADAPPSIFHAPLRGAPGGVLTTTPDWGKGAWRVQVAARVPDGAGGELWLRGECSL